MPQNYKYGKDIQTYEKMKKGESVLLTRKEVSALKVALVKKYMTSKGKLTCRPDIANDKYRVWKKS